MKTKSPTVISDDNYIDQISYIFSKFSTRGDLNKNQDTAQDINVKYIHQCIRLTLKRKLYPELCKNSVSEKINFIMDNHVKNKWFYELEKLDNPSLIKKDVCYFDHSTGICCYIDAIVRINTDVFAFNFRHLNKKDFNNIIENGPFKKDVVSMVASLYLSDLHNGIMIYEHNGFKAFHINRSEEIYDAVIKKCKKIKSFIVNKEMPKKCEGHLSKKCNGLCDL